MQMHFPLWHTFPGRLRSSSHMGSMRVLVACGPHVSLPVQLLDRSSSSSTNSHSCSSLAAWLLASGSIGASCSVLTALALPLVSHGGGPLPAETGRCLTARYLTASATCCQNSNKPSGCNKWPRRVIGPAPRLPAPTQARHSLPGFSRRIPSARLPFRSHRAGAIAGFSRQVDSGQADSHCAT